MEEGFPMRDNAPARQFFGKPTLIVVSAMALLVASLTAAFADVFYVALPGVLLLLAYVAAFSRNPGNIILSFLLVGVPYLVTGSLLTGSLFFGTVIAVAAGTFLVTYCKTPVYAILSSALAFGAAALASDGTLDRALPALAALPAYLLLSLAFHRGERRSVTVAAGQVGLSLVLLGLFAMVLARTDGGLTRDGILSFMESFRGELFDAVSQLREALRAAFLEAGGEIPETLERLLDDDNLKEIIRRATNLLPGIAAAVCGVAAFFGERFFRSILFNTGDERAARPESILFVMGIPSAVVYLASLLLSFATDPGTMVYAVAENLSIILLLPFFVEGAQRMVALFARLPAGARWLFLLLFVSLLCCLSAGAVEVLAFYAAIETILIPIRIRIRQRGPGGRGDD